MEGHVGVAPYKSTGFIINLWAISSVLDMLCLVNESNILCIPLGVAFLGQIGSSLEQSGFRAPDTNLKNQQR
jgi:hypothetical protein